MSNMYEILKKFNDLDKKPLKESRRITECPAEGDMGMGGGASVNISGNPNDIAAVLRALSGIEGGGAGPQVAMTKPLAIDMPDEPEGPEEPDMDAMKAKMGKMSDEDIAEWDNEPNEDYRDHHHMTKDLSGGINRQKKMYAKAQDGDNAMAVESIKDRLYKALNEKKSKPDFLDVDKDGNKKEPMKKAIKDKKKKPFGEAAKPDYIDADKDGNKKEPMKKAFKDKEKAKKK